jgi:hypothetical protein
MDNNLPDPEQLCEKLARLHRDSVLPNGHYGFPSRHVSGFRASVGSMGEELGDVLHETSPTCH